MITREFLTAGRSIFTIEIPAAFAAAQGTPGHYTYRVGFKAGSEGRPDVWFVSLLSGPDNTADYTYIGMMDSAGSFRTTAKSRLAADSMPCAIFAKLARRVFEGTAAAVEAAGFKVHHEGRCGRCGRVLTVPESVESGIGPECARRMMGCRSI